MSLVVNEGVILDIRSKVGPCADIVLSYAWNPALMDERAFAFLFREIQEQGERQKKCEQGDLGEEHCLSEEHQLFTRLIISMNPPADLPDAQKMQIVFGILGKIAAEAAPKKNPTPLELMEPLALAQAATEMQEMGVVSLIKSLFYQTDVVPIELVTSLATSPMREQAADCRSWLKEATSSLQNEVNLTYHVNGDVVIKTPFALVPKEIDIFKSLRVLDLSHNAFIFVPREMGGLEKLELLDLSGNALQTLPNACTSLKSLKKLNLRGNQLRSLPALDLLPELRYVDLSRNPRNVLLSPCISALEDPQREPPCEVVCDEMLS